MCFEINVKCQAVDIEHIIPNASHDYNTLKNTTTSMIKSYVT